MRVILLFIVVFNMNSIAENALPLGWPWKGVDTMAYVIDTDPKALDFIVDNKIKYVRIHFFNKKVMRDYNVSAKQALELNLKWAKTINDKLDTQGIRSFITIADFPVSLRECVNKKESSYWNNKSCINQIYNDVKRTVNYFKDSNILGYEFFGEPVVLEKGKSIQPKNWNKIFQNIIKITRDVDQKKWLFYSPGPWGLPSNYNNVIPFSDSKIIYNVHMYIPHRYSHQGIGKQGNQYSYPGWIRFKYWDKDRLEKSLLPLIYFQKKYNKPISISEFSAALWGKGNNHYISDLIQIFNKYQWSWMYFNIGSEYKGWDARYNASIDKDLKKTYIYFGNKSNRMKVLKNYLNGGIE